MKNLLIAILTVLSAYFFSPNIGVGLGQEHNDRFDAITKSEVRDHVYYLASDFLEGRLTGSEGYKQAAYYLASQLNSAGLAPIVGNSGGQESYLQPIDFVISTISPESTLRIRKGQKEIALISGDKFIPVNHGQAFKDGHYVGNPVFVGYGLEEPEDGWNDYEKTDVSGKIAVMIPGTPMKNGQPVLSAKKNEDHLNFIQSARKRMLSALNHKAAGIIMALDSATARMWPQLASTMNKPARRLKADETKESSNYFPVFLLHPESAVALLEETGFDPVSGKGDVRPAPLKNSTLIFDLRYKIEREFVCHNVVGFIPGSDPRLKDEFVVVGAHLDHLGIKDEGVFNGADDNASGCAAILEAAEAVAASPTRRSLFFVFFTGEEGGGHGSFHFVEHFPFSLEQIALAINVDMVGRNCGRFPDSLLGLTPDHLKPELAEFIEKANQSISHVNLKTSRQENDLGASFGGSDEVGFHIRGIPTVLMTSGASHPDFHKASDDPTKINYDKVADASRLIYALATTAANADKIY
jgi:hypothetical protein